ncbi:MAG: type II toxin-antitoxin system ParD family antitoxin [Novosphingobium sp.]|nr:type II toxin-antitoxin system ParD family antitoxin [Novosphingobium sp.]
MGKLERITVTMPEELAAKLRAAVESGEYATTSEIVRDALQEWSQQQDRREAGLQKLRDMIEEGMKGPFLDGPTVLAELRAKYAVPRE